MNIVQLLAKFLFGMYVLKFQTSNSKLLKREMRFLIHFLSTNVNIMLLLTFSVIVSISHGLSSFLFTIWYIWLFKNNLFVNTRFDLRRILFISYSSCTGLLSLIFLYVEYRGTTGPISKSFFLLNKC